MPERYSPQTDSIQSTPFKAGFVGQVIAPSDRACSAESLTGFRGSRAASRGLRTARTCDEVVGEVGVDREGFGDAKLIHDDKA